METKPKPKPEPKRDALRKSDGSAYITADRPSAALSGPSPVESEIAVFGRLSRGRSRKSRILGRIAAALILLPILLGIVLQVLNP